MTTARVHAADVGGTSTRVALVDERGTILDRRTAPTPQDPVAGLALIRMLWDELGPADGEMLAIAGGIRLADGEITQSPNLKRWEGICPGETLDCLVINDASAATIGEAWCGALRGKESALMVTLGTGVGGGVFMNGRLWAGANGCAGEIGHVPVGDCLLEDLASATAIATAAGTPDAKTAARKARDGDVLAQDAFEFAGRALGIALAGLVNVLNPDAICLGGGAGAGAFDLLEPALQRELKARAFHLALEDLIVVPAALGNDAGLVGAAKVALDDIR